MVVEVCVRAACSVVSLASPLSADRASDHSRARGWVDSAQSLSMVASSKDEACSLQLTYMKIIGLWEGMHMKRRYLRTDLRTCN